MNLIEKFKFDEQKVINAISEECKKKNIDVFLVGGVVRDILINRDCHDIDICIEGNPKDIIPLLGDVKEYIYYDKFQTSTILFNNYVKIDLITCRKEVYNTNGSLPEITPATINEDLYRRDFTINAIAYDILKGKLIDPFDGINHIENKIIKSVHSESYLEDPTRIFRAFKYANRYGFSIYDKESIKNAISQKALDSISNDRIIREITLLCQEECWINNIVSCEEYGIFKIQHSILSAENSMCNYETLNDRLINLFVSIIDENFREIFCNNSILHKEQRSAFKNYSKLIDVTKRKLEKSMDNYDLYINLNKLSINEIKLLSYNKKLFYKLYNYIIKMKNTALNVKGEHISELGISNLRLYSSILNYLLRLKLNTGIIDEKNYLTNNLGEILNVIEYKDR
ncbi:multifunctional CCA protein [Clostridium homopropionicum DSM 5847]|uniref:Multifunctional CCA protein n=1 Tax=Clostridium homopropionicum DSM 5847 TaxID=1121318 RepID=A0A0L6ZD77_9CLOT|nr:CCA tRNA nucleotidyltransferase [Clostridium homopropionicum]KOA20925.1 multifunctional CCA protein [Clostridium homopropionicum DSM 5847]SFG02063.1 tRNA nucleotidyltransferase (CCA-adding enzyme) [Clostridium homopropionicum]